MTQTGPDVTNSIDRDVEPVASGSLPPALRTALAMGVTAVVLIAALSVGMGGAVAAMFGGPFGLLVPVVVMAVAVVLISLIVSSLTGRRRVGAAIVVTVTAFVALGVAVFGFGTVPMLWVQPGFELVYVLIAVPSALMLGLFLETWPLRVVGLVGAALLVAGAVWVSVPETQAEGPSAEQQQLDANFEAYIDSRAFPMVADMPGGTVAGVVADGGPARALTVTADGGVVEVVIDRQPIATNPETAPCLYLAAPDMGLEDTDTLDEYADWCVRDGDEWRLTDGTGYARMENGALIAVTSAISQNVRAGAGERAADATEVLEAWRSLRLMTEAEVREQREREQQVRDEQERG